MRPYVLAFLAIFTNALIQAQQNNCASNRPPRIEEVSVCYGYAISRAFGYSGSSSLAYTPEISWMNTTYFDHDGGTDWSEGDIVTWGPPSVDYDLLSSANGHAAFVHTIIPNNFPDGVTNLSATGKVRDDDPNGPASWQNVILGEVASQGSGETPNVSMAEVNHRRETNQGDVYKGYWRLKNIWKCDITFANSFGAGQMNIGKYSDGSYRNEKVEPSFVTHATWNSQIPVGAITPQEVASTKQTFSPSLGWRKDGQYHTSNVAFDVNVADHAGYIASFTSSAPAGNLFSFENRSDGVGIGSIIKINNEITQSPTQQFGTGVFATAYSSLLANHVYYTFQNWTPGGSTNLTITPSTPGIYYANFAFNYVLPPEGVNPYANPVGQNVRITWDKHPSPYVTHYQVWRKVKNVHNAMVIATLPSSATSYTDYGYTLTDGYTDNLIDYDVRARYYIPPVRDVYSSPNWVTVFGAESEMKMISEKSVEGISYQDDPFSLSAFPNPFNPSTTVNYTLEHNSVVEIKIFDITGRPIYELVNSVESKGKHSVQWNSNYSPSGSIASGIYLLRFTATALESGETTNAMRKLQFIK